MSVGGPVAVVTRLATASISGFSDAELFVVSAFGSVESTAEVILTVDGKCWPDVWSAAGTIPADAFTRTRNVLAGAPAAIPDAEHVTPPEYGTQPGAEISVMPGSGNGTSTLNPPLSEGPTFVTWTL